LPKGERGRRGGGEEKGEGWTVTFEGCQIETQVSEDERDL